MGSTVTLVAGLGAGLLATITWASSASAQQSTLVTQPAQPAVMERTTYSLPNPRLIGGGLIVFGAAYVPSVLVAAANNTSYDNHLYIPVVGPWLDLANRPSCGGFGQTGCGTEGGFKALLIIDGAVQGLGALVTVLGLVTPERRTTWVTAKAEKPTIHVVPAEVSRNAYGLAAFGSF